MKTSTVIALAILGVVGVVAYQTYLKNQSQTNTTALASGVSNLLGDVIGSIGGVFSGGSSNSSGGGGTYSSPDYSQWNSAYTDPTQNV